MLKSFLIISIRHLLKNKVFSFINVSGLTLGLICFTIIFLFVEHQLSYDRFHHDPEKIYRVVKNFVNEDGTVIPDATTPPALSYTIAKELPEVESVTRFFPNRGRLFLLQAGDKRFYETSLIRVDGNFFKVFDFVFVAGDKGKAFNDVHSVVLTESTAKKYFDAQDPIGKVIRMNVNNGTDYVVTGVVKDVPQNSHFTFDVLVPFESRRNPDTNWDFYGFYTYVRLKNGTNPTLFESKVKELFARRQPNSTNQYYTQALTDIHLNSKLKWELSANGDLLYIKILSTIALFVILIASINYINLTTAQSARRAKEVGVRKVTGAIKHILVRQFLTESLLTVLVSLAFSILLTSLLLPLIKPMVGFDLSAFLPESQYLTWVLPVCVLFIGLLAGLYPALYLSSFEPLKVLRSNFFRTQSGVQLRRILVVFQFVVSSVLIIGALTLSQQLTYMQQKDLGFNQENVLMLPNVRGGIGNTNNPASMLEDMKKIPGVTRIARADGVLGFNNSTNGISANKRNHIGLNFIRADYDFLPTLQIELKDGRNFSDQFVSDSSAIILNEKAVAQLGLKLPYIGQSLTWDDEAGKTHNVTLIGIAKDFHFTSLREEIKPFGFILEVGNGSTFFLKIQSSSVASTLEDVEKIWIKHNPERPFEYAFQDEQLARQHESDARFQKLFSSFTGLAILIACLGLFGLVTYLAESKTKEIGIRKVLGASVNSILLVLSKDFFWLIVIALVIASPLAYVFMMEWLQNFAYHINLSWTVFALAGITSLFIALLTISFQSIKAALANPANSLRSE